jgi:hypothetical protein
MQSRKPCHLENILTIRVPRCKVQYCILNKNDTL